MEEPSTDLLNSLATVMRSLKDHQVVKVRDTLLQMREHPAIVDMVEREIRWRALPRVFGEN
jgi:hypothetical protein